MKIGMNALFFQFPASGSGQYMLHLLQEMPKIDQHHSYQLFGMQEIANEQTHPYEVCPAPVWARKNKSIEKLVWEQWTCPAAARRASVDLLHVPYFAPPLFPRSPTVVTIHDVIPFRLPAYLPDAKIKAYMRLMARAAHSARMIITVSQHAKQDIMDVLKIPSERIRVTYEAASEKFSPLQDPAKLAAVRARYGIGERFVFYLGGLDQRKNVPQLVRAFARVYRKLGDPDLQLFVSGDPDRKRGPLFPDPRLVPVDPDIREKIIYRFVEEEDKAAVYSAASLFVFPSLYEGFGLDPLEAMACGTPVVCSNRTSLPEIVGDAALSVDPENLQALVEAMCQVLNNSQLQLEMRDRSLKQAARFSWRKTAEETLSVYEEVQRNS
jgi:glycosyltransferase involved in cell wall biosynthesis